MTTNTNTNIVLRIRAARSAAEWCNIVDAATPAERAAVRAELLEWQTIANDGAEHYRRAGRRMLAVAVVGAVGAILAMLAMVASIG